MDEAHGTGRMVDAIVVPLDGSERSERAIPVASAVASRSGARMILMTAVAPDGDNPTSRLEKLAGDFDDVETSVVVIHDRPPASAIGLAAREAGNSAVCMTTHGRGALRWAVLGSVAEDVVRIVERPVLMVGRRCDPGWTARRGKMLVCLSGTERSERVVEHAASWAEALGLELHGAIVIHPLDVDDAERPEELNESIQAGLEEHGGTFPVTMLRSTYPAGALADLADELDVTMVAMASHARAGLGRVALGSVTMGVVGLARCPVLVTHAP